MKTCNVFVCALLAGSLAAQQQPPELTGTVSFSIGSDSGRVERIAVQVGDGGTGKYKAILAGDPLLPTHAIYRPRDLKPFGGKLLLPIVAFGNGGCRNSSGEFRNLLSDIASHGYVVVAIGPAGDAVVAGSEGRTGMTQASQLLDGVDWIARENSREGSEYYLKIDTGKVAVMGQSCGTGQASQVSSDPRVATTVLLNGGGPMGGARPGPAEGGAAATPAPARGGANLAPGEYGNANAATAVNDMFSALDKMSRRYAPYAPAIPQTLPSGAAGTQPVTFHGPVAFIPGGYSDLAFKGAVAGYEAVQKVTALLAYQDVGHYPATYRQPNGGAYAVAVNAWLDWHLKGDRSASEMFVGASCGLCQDPKWTIKIKNVPEAK
ncbi:MAG: hypothetical protein ABSH56_13305 [Bryobacteraceae bacterium]